MTPTKMWTKCAQRNEGKNKKIWELQSIFSAYDLCQLFSDDNWNNKKRADRGERNSSKREEKMNFYGNWNYLHE